MPLRHDVRTVTIPGCVDGWVALHERFGRLPLRRRAGAGHRAWPRTASRPHPCWSARSPWSTTRPGAVWPSSSSRPARPGRSVRRPGVGPDVAGHRRRWAIRLLRGRVRRRAGCPAARATSPPTTSAGSRPTGSTRSALDVWGHRLWTIPPNSQGYLTLADAWIAARPARPARSRRSTLGPPADRGRHRRPVTTARTSSTRAPTATSLLAPARIAPRRDAISTESTSIRWRELPSADGDTTYLCVVDDDRMAVSLIQSNAAGFGSWLVEPTTGINLHNRGLGFSLEPGHPAEYGPGRRPPHTLSPLLVTHGPTASWRPRSAPWAATRSRRSCSSSSPASSSTTSTRPQAIAAGRWALHGERTGFDTWTERVRARACSSRATPRPDWDAGLAERGHRVVPHACRSTPPSATPTASWSRTTAAWPPRQTRGRGSAAPPGADDPRRPTVGVHDHRASSAEPGGCTFRSCASTRTSSGPCPCPTPAIPPSPPPRAATGTATSSPATRTCSTGRRPPTRSASTPSG